MLIPINKEIEVAYKDQFIRGFSVRETGYIALALAIIFVVGFIVWYFFKLPINLCAYIGMPFAVPPIIIGFKYIQGLTVVEYIKEIFYEKKISELTYDAAELPENEYCYQMEKTTNKRRGKQR